MNLKNTLIIIFTTGIYINTRAQGDIDGLLRGGTEDASKIMAGYVEPIIQSFGYGLANGWYNTAKPHKPAGFDLTATVTLAFVPDEDLFYSVNDLALSEVIAVSPSDGVVPTIFGDPGIQPVYAFRSIPDSTFVGPKGFDLATEVGAFIPVPMVQLGLGLIKNTEIKIRYIPETTVDDFTTKMFGIGVMHDIKQYMPLIKKAPFDLSIFVGYNKLTSSLLLSSSFDDAGNGDQLGVFSSQSITFQALVSKKFSIITLYAGVGGNKIKTNFDIKGTYVLDIFDPLVTSFVNTTIVDPVSLTIRGGGIRATGGIRLKFGPLTFHGDYTLQEYNTFTGGVGLSFR